MYRASPVHHSSSALRLIELLLSTPDTVTLYSSYDRLLSQYPDSSVVHVTHNIPIPRTIFHLDPDRKKLRGYVESVGGFPVILKVLGSSEGVGVIKIESYASLFSIVDYLLTKHRSVMMREFISVAAPLHSYRGVVLGDELVAVYRNESVEEDDFRSNVNQEARNRRVVEVDGETEKVLVRAVQVLGLEMGAVDFIFDKDNQMAKILEVNFPFNFVPMVEQLNIPFHEQMVGYLTDKAQRSAPTS